MSPVEVKAAIAKLERPKVIESQKVLEKAADDATTSNRRRLKIFQNITLTKKSGGSGSNGGKKKNSPLQNAVSQVNKKSK